MEEFLDANLFHVSKTNVNYEKQFGSTEEDKKLIANMKASMNIEDPFLARPEPKYLLDEGDKLRYGVYAGKRRFEAALIVGFTKFQVGKDCIINDVTEEEAEEASWAENYFNQEYRVGMDPVARAKGLQKIIGRRSLHDYSKRSGIPVSTLSEYLSVLKTSPTIQKGIKNGKLTFSNGLDFSKLHLDYDTQEELGKVLETEGKDPFKKRLSKHRKKRSRGIPADVYVVYRVLYDKTDPEDSKKIEILDNAAKLKDITTPELIKEIVNEHI